MNKTIKILLLIISFSILSCKNENFQSKTENLKPNVHSINSEILNFQFPNTIPSNKEIHGNIKYDISLDSTTEKEILKRYIFLHVVIDSDKNPLKLESIKKVENRKVYIDTTGHGNFDFKVNLKDKGEKTFHAVIEDSRIMKSKKNEEGFEVITQTIVLTKNVIIE